MGSCGIMNNQRDVNHSAQAGRSVWQWIMGNESMKTIALSTGGLLTMSAYVYLTILYWS